jgi:hypothetical protein
VKKEARLGIAKSHFVEWREMMGVIDWIMLASEGR